MTTMEKRKKQNNNLWHTILLAMCGLILGLNIYAANAKTLIGNQMPMPFGYGAAVVLSGSMEPELSKGDLILVKESSMYNIGDIVVYQDINCLIVHRIVNITGDKIVTKGDANPVEDESIDISSLKGNVFLSIPFLGHIINFLKTGPGIILTILLALFLIEFPRYKEQQRNEAQKKKIIEEIEQLRKI